MEDTSKYQKDVHRGGAVFKCDIRENNQCIMIPFDRNGKSLRLFPLQLIKSSKNRTYILARQSFCILMNFFFLYDHFLPFSIVLPDTGDWDCSLPFDNSIKCNQYVVEYSIDCRRLF